MDKNKKDIVFLKNKKIYIIMEEAEDINVQINNPRINKIAINASEIVKKFRSLKDRQLFCLEMSK